MRRAALAAAAAVVPMASWACIIATLAGRLVTPWEALTWQGVILALYAGFLIMLRTAVRGRREADRLAVLLARRAYSGFVPEAPPAPGQERPSGFSMTRFVEALGEEEQP